MGAYNCTRQTFISGGGGGQIKRCNWAFCGSMGGLKGDEVACFVTPANVFRKSIFDSIKI